MRTAVVASAIVLVASGAATAAAHDSGRDAADLLAAPGISLTVVERAVSDTVIDNGSPGDSIGDVIAFGNPIYNESNTVRIGRNQGSCVRTNPGRSFECEWTLILPEGQIVAQGPFKDRGPSTMAITGGTGRYEHATGQMVLRARTATTYEFRYTILA